MSRNRNRKAGKTGIVKSLASKIAGKPVKDPRVGTMALWIDTPFGPLYPCIRPAKTLAPGEVQTLQVRARRREYLDHFRAKWCPEAGEVLSGEQVTGHKTDYPWRCYVSPEQLAEAMRRMILKIDSGKFKPLTEGPEGLDNRKLASELHSVYTSMWSTQLRLSDGTSSYDWTPGKYSGGSGDWMYSAPDSASPSDMCQTEGHYFGREVAEPKQPYAGRKCLDCPATRLNGTITYPDGHASAIKPGSSWGKGTGSTWGGTGLAPAANYGPHNHLQGQIPQSSGLSNYTYPANSTSGLGSPDGLWPFPADDTAPEPEVLASDDFDPQNQGTLPDHKVPDDVACYYDGHWFTHWYDAGEGKTRICDDCGVVQDYTGQITYPDWATEATTPAEYDAALEAAAEMDA
jgi:hypothetical protein